MSLSGSTIHALRRRSRPEGECWVWRGAVGSHGYGQLWVNGGMRTAHRVSYEAHKGPIGEGLLVCHRCDNKLCWNPDHLFTGTHGDNAEDMARKGRSSFQRPDFVRMKGERAGGARLTAASVREIRKLLEKGIAQTAIADLYGVRQPMISRINTGANWK